MRVSASLFYCINLSCLFFVVVLGFFFVVFFYPTLSTSFPAAVNSVQLQLLDSFILKPIFYQK